MPLFFLGLHGKSVSGRRMFALRLIRLLLFSLSDTAFEGACHKRHDLRRLQRFFQIILSAQLYGLKVSGRIGMAAQHHDGSLTMILDDPR